MSNSGSLSFNSLGLYADEHLLYTKSFVKLCTIYFFLFVVNLIHRYKMMDGNNCALLTVNQAIVESSQRTTHSSAQRFQSNCPVMCGFDEMNHKKLIFKKILCLDVVIHIDNQTTSFLHYMQTSLCFVLEISFLKQDEI